MHFRVMQLPPTDIGYELEVGLKMSPANHVIQKILFKIQSGKPVIHEFAAAHGLKTSGRIQSDGSVA